MMLSLLFQSPLEFIVVFGGLILAIGLHEAAHCYMADYLGDPTPRSQGRLTLNPLAHLDPLGTIAILLTNFGWGKASPFDPYNLKDPKRDTAIIALAGPVSNILVAVLLSILFHSLSNLSILGILSFLIQLNINLAIFNLIPVPPLDGSKILGLFLSHETALKYQRNNNILFLIPLLLVAPMIVSPISSFILRFLLP
ncbi:MAG: Peptidase M50 [Candidatus Amesbacteria bacterium GW2011_GWA2_42_12]|uniref:Peptidase M50 n=1 Tax=Candidatus Amesbacteria bacterium GW2011_GWA2_42_12 TaxID=1618356 RepID=A0A0G1B622_9BACT|nr:MAG: Peptidase M50 [Candidatus Amesbacteria bacterium GW2011_GWA2_42_12]